MLNSKLEKKLKKKNYRKWIRRSASVLRTGFDVVLAIQKKEPLLMGVAIASVVETVEQLLEKEDRGYDKSFRDMGMFPILSKNKLARLVYSTLKYMDIPHEVVNLGEGEEGVGSLKIYIFKIDESPLYCVVESGNLQAMYADNEDRIMYNFSHTVSKSFGKFIVIKTIQEGWREYPYIQTIGIPTDAYIPTVDPDKYLASVRAFHKKGINRSSLFFGEPGTGKTTFAALVANSLGGTLMCIDAAALERIIESGMQIEEIMEIIDPSILLFDNMDRADDLDMMLETMERINRFHKSKQILVIGSINSIEDVPEALKRPGRYDELVEFPLPNKKQSKAILKIKLKEYGVELQEEDIDTLIAGSKGMSGAYLNEIALQCSINPFGDEIVAKVKYMRRMKGLSEGEKKKKKKGKKKGGKNRGLTTPSTDKVYRKR